MVTAVVMLSPVNFDSSSAIRVSLAILDIQSHFLPFYRPLHHSSLCQNWLSCSLRLRIQLLQWRELRRRAASKARMANLRRDSTRRSYRSNAGSRRAISVMIVVNLSGSASFEERNFTSSSGTSSHRQHLRIIRSAGHGAERGRGVNRPGLRQYGVLSLALPGWRPLQQFAARVPQLLARVWDRNQEAGLARTGVHFSPSGPCP